MSEEQTAEGGVKDVEGDELMAELRRQSELASKGEDEEEVTEFLEDVEEWNFGVML